MKILQIMGGYLDGGAEIFYIDAIIAIKNVNEEQYAIVNKKNKKGISKLKKLKIPFKAVSFNKLFKWPTKSSIKKVVKEFKPDIVHTHAAKAGALGRRAAYKLGVKQIYHTFHGHVFHSYIGSFKTKIFKEIERNLAKKTTKIIAISDIQKRELNKIHRICPEKNIEVFL